MDVQTTQRLVALNNEFYLRNTASFSATRQYAWDGWSRLLENHPRRPQSVIDIACGNMRFKQFLDESYGAGSFEYLGVDSCDELVPPGMESNYAHIDILADLPSSLSNITDLYDSVACFGFMHHVPGYETRRLFVDLLLDLVAPQGRACISFWQFGRDEKMLQKAEESTSRGVNELGIRLESGDYLLGWKDTPSTYRYCHTFTDAEIDALVNRTSNRATLIDRFRADGKTGDLNTYLVLERMR